jgi:UDP-glucose 4-epimerase
LAIFEMSKTVLITGVAGFLGRHVAQHFAGAGWAVIGVDEAPTENVQLPGLRYRRLRLPGPELEDLLRTAPPQVCVHCAGCASVGSSMDNPTADYRGNAVLVFELLEALRRAAPECRFLLLSSAAVYGDPQTLPVGEEHAIRPISPYGYHKRQAELICEEYARIYRVPTAVARIFSAYGPGLRRQVVWDTCARVLATGVCNLHGTGAESRDFIHASDVARGLRVLAEAASFDGAIYNLASGREVTISQVARTILDALHCKAPLVFDGAVTAGNPLNWRADISKIAALGFAPGISLESGLEQTAHWAQAELAVQRA